MAWQTPKTDWQAADVVSKDDFNRIEGNIQHLQDTKETPADAQAKAEAAAGAVRAELNSHKNENATGAHKAKNIAIEDAGGHFTATDVEGALNELFTDVSNGKQLVGGAITDVDDSVVIPADPTFNDLVNAIGQIRTGVSFATGSSKPNSGYNLSIRGLSFRPWIVLCTYYKISRYVMFLTAYGNFLARLPAEQFFGPQNGCIYDDGFLLEGSQYSGWADETITWYAWGIE